MVMNNYITTFHGTEMNLNYIGHFSNDTQYSIGDICIKNDELMLYRGDEIWVKISNIGMGGNYVNNHMLRTLSTHPTHCKCCGAILKSNTCEYCGAEYFNES